MENKNAENNINISNVNTSEINEKVAKKITPLL